MDINTENGEDVFTLSVSGQINASLCGEFQEAVDKAILEGKKQLVIDFRKLDLISSAGIRVLVKTAKEAKKAGREMEIHISDRGLVKEIFYTTGIYSILKIVEKR